MSESVEIVGYSLGTMLANDMAARFDARATNIADIGLPDVKGRDGQSLYTDALLQNVRENVVSLAMPGDPYLETAGKVHGTVHTLKAPPATEIVKSVNADSLTATFSAETNHARLVHHINAYEIAAQNETTETLDKLATLRNQPAAPQVHQHS